VPSSLVFETTTVSSTVFDFPTVIFMLSPVVHLSQIYCEHRTRIRILEFPDHVIHGSGKWDNKAKINDIQRHSFNRWLYFMAIICLMLYYLRNLQL